MLNFTNSKFYAKPQYILTKKGNKYICRLFFERFYKKSLFSQPRSI